MDEITRTYAGDGTQGSVETQPQRRGDYEVLEEIGEGGMGRVSRARDERLGRDVALKELVRSSDASRARFLREARVTARLQHPAIVPVYEAGHWPSGELFYAMKLISGASMREHIADSHCYDQRIALLPEMIAVAEAVAYAHSKGVIHRDLKPANVVLGPYGETLVVDWGLAKLLDEPRDVDDLADADDSELTRVGEVVGTPAYMPPEQAAGEPVDQRADVYAFGAMMYHLLAGIPPYGSGGSGNVLRRVMTTDPVPIAQREPDVPEALAAIVDKAMAREPDNRYANGGELAADLKRFRTGKLVQAHAYSRRALVSRWVREHRTVATAIAVGLCVAVAAGTWSFVREQTLRRRAEGARDRAEQQSLALLETQARSELRRGRPIRAATLLAEAYRRDPTNLAVQWLLRDAMAVVDAYAGALEHDAEIICVAYSPDGAWLATGDSAGRLTVWDAATFEPRFSVDAHDKSIRFVAFDPSGARIATGARDGRVKLWSSSTEALLQELRGHQESVRTVEFSVDGTRIVTASLDGTARVWDRATGDSVAVFEVGARVNSAMFSNDGRRVLVASALPAAGEWDIETGRLVREVGRHAGSITVARYSPNGARIATAGDDAVARVWDAANGALVASFDGHDTVVQWLAFEPSGAWIATTGEDRTAMIWDARSAARVVSLDASARAVWSVAISPDGTRVVVASSERVARVWNVEAYRRGVQARVAVLGSRERTTLSARFTQDGRYVVAGSDDGVVRMWKVTSRELVRQIQTGHSRGVWVASASPDGSLIATAGWAPRGGDRDVFVWDAGTGRKVATLAGHEDAVYDVAFHPSKPRVVTASFDGTVRQWQARNGEPLGAVLRPEPREPRRALVNHRELEGGVAMTAARYSPDGLRIATAGVDGAIRLWDAMSLELVAGLDGHDSVVGSVAFSSDGLRLVSAGWDDHVAKVWNLRTNDLERVLLGSSNRLMWAGFDPTGTRIATASTDEIGRIFDVSTGRMIAELPGGHFGAAFSPDGTHLVAAGQTLSLWDVSLSERSPQRVAVDVARVSPWSLVDGRLQRRPHRD